MAFADRDDFKPLLKRPDLDSPGGATGYVGRRRKTPASKAEEAELQPECGHRQVVRLPENTSELCVQRLIAARPSAQQRRLLARHRRAQSCIVQVPLVPLERRSRRQQPQPGRPLPGNACCSSLRGTESRQPPGPRSTRQATIRLRRSSCW